MRRLPNVNNLVAQITQRAAEEKRVFEKQAKAPAPEYIVPVAQELQKVAELCRSGGATVTLGDVQEFAQRLMR